MKDQAMIIAELREEISRLKQRIGELEHSDSERKRTEELLRESDEHLRMFIEHSADVIYTVGLDYKIHYISSSVEHWTGYKPEELIGRSVAEISMLAPECLDQAYRDISSVFSGKTIFTSEYIFLAKDGSRRVSEISGAPLKNNGAVVGLISTARDITERKRTEEALRKSEQRMRLVLEGTDQGLWDFDLLAQKVNYSDNWQKILGYGPEESDFDYEWWINQINPESRASFDKALLDYMSGHTKYLEWEYQIRNKSGEWQWIHALGIFTDTDKTGLPLRMIGTHRNISVQKKVEEALRASEERYRNLFDNHAAVKLLIDPDTGHIIDANEAAVHYYGWSHEQLKQMKIQEINTLPPEDVKKEMERASTNKRVYFEFRHRRADGSIRDVEVFSSKIESEGKILLHSIIHDIAERKLVEEEKRVLEERLHHLNKMESIGTLAGGIAHDFNNLLMGIQGHVSLMLLEIDPSHPHHESLEQIEVQVQSGAALTRQLLGFARGGRYEIKPTDINDIVAKALSMFGRTRKEITIQQKYDNNLWTVDVDQGQMEQVFLNLCVNASQAMPGGGELYLETGNVLLGDEQAISYAITPGKYVKITVADNGMGMDEKTRERIFDPFFTTKAMGRGTGLGLAMVYGIIKGHGGMIDVTSEPGRGTTFNIYLPATEKGIAKGKTVATEIHTGTATILLVDDEQPVLQITRRLLEFLGHRVYEASSGQEALSVYLERQKEIDLVILDMVMPGLSGGETFDRLKEINPAIRALLSSGYSIDGQAQQILEKGCNGFIQKPFRVVNLSRKIREILD